MPLWKEGKGGDWAHWPPFQSWKAKLGRVDGHKSQLWDGGIVRRTMAMWPSHVGCLSSHGASQDANCVLGSF